ncbi:MAG: 50S ribosomal protein L16 3-hydroxylase [Granulosicoccus sp.]|jgi:50S ribosomal protein L16 3-hydroxylase
MNESNEVPTGIQWSDGMDEAVFLRDYWQQKPLLIRQAFPDFQTPLDADELAGLSLEPETTPRLIIQDGAGNYHLEHGPFEEDRFATLDGNNWSLLVTDVEKHIPELASYLEPFQFLPSWRIDDLMISYAPVGASVGAHIDEYDVFLLQAGGVRQWSIDQRQDIKHELLPDSTLKILATFAATDCWDLEAGDMLYLPPGIPHHGVATVESCTTWSIGFRAPAIPDMIMRVSEMLAESLPAIRYTDGAIDIATPGEISASAITRMKTLWTQATMLDDTLFANFVGALLTESGTINSDDSVYEAYDNAGDIEQFIKAPFTQIVWHQKNIESSEPMVADAVTLFVNGESYYCSRGLAIELSQREPIPITVKPARNSSDQSMLEMLTRSGCLIPY